MSNNYEFTDLILLVGSNPLPNYVVAKFFLSKNDKLENIWLLCSKDTKKPYAESIKAVLSHEFKSKSVHIEPHELPNTSEADLIFRDIKKFFGNRLSNKEVHLNYTGGTKAMAVHAYRSMEVGIKEKWIKIFSASYLDARDFRLLFDRKIDKDDYEENYSCYSNTGDLRKLITLDLKNLFGLHNTEIIGQTKKYLHELELHELDNIMQNFAKLADVNKISDFIRWKNLVNRLPNKKYSDGELESVINEQLTFFTKNNNPELFALLASFPEKDRLADAEGNWLYYNFKISGKSKSSPNLRNFLDGLWLEAYVYWVLEKKIFEEGIKVIKIATNYDLKTKDGKGSEKFEMDILVINGYQICGISCATGDGLKAKGFEVILRSKQLGGDEAKSVLVTLLDPKEKLKLENDLKATLNIGSDRFMLLGIDDLPPDKMWNKLKDHIF